MLFNPRECALIESALETYDDVDRHVFRTIDLQHKYVGIALSKIRSISVLTNFTKQDFSIMAAAVTKVMGFLDGSGADAEISSELSPLLAKLFELAEPDGGLK